MLMEWWGNAMDRAVERRIRNLVPSVRAEDIRPIYHDANRIAKKGYFWRVMLLGALVGGIFLGIIPKYYGPVWGVILGSLGFGVASLLWHKPFQRRFERGVLSAANRHGYRVCVRCGYDLENLESNVSCPECGFSREINDSVQTEASKS